jgi:hypothetical protein
VARATMMPCRILRMVQFLSIWLGTAASKRAA